MPTRILLVDESIAVRDVLRDNIECLGAAVVAEAESTLQALDLFRTVAPNLVILDVAVSQTGGIGALALFRIMRSELPDVPILVMSGLALPELRRSFLAEGALDYLSKPFNSHAFARIRTLLLENLPALGTGSAVPADPGRVAPATAGERLVR